MYGVGSIQYTWNVTRTTTGAQTNTTAADASARIRQNNMHYWIQNAEKAAIGTLTVMGMSF